MFLYLIYLALSPLVWCLLFIGSIFNQKIRQNFFHAKSSICAAKNKISKTDKTVLLFHAASAGEFEQLKPILTKIDRTKYFLVQSFTSPTIYNQENQSKIVDAVCYQPFDIIWLSNYFFKSINPEKYIITRHDIWPNHIMTASNMGVICILINANIHKNSIWMKRYFKSFTKIIFKGFNFILTPSSRIENNIKKLFSNHNIIITGDSRFNQIINRSNKNIKLLPESFEKSDNIIFASIDSMDEDVIFAALKELYTNGDEDLYDKKQNLIFVPHEVDTITINQLLKKLDQHLFTSKLYSLLEDNTNDSGNVLIVDQVGLLADLYRYSKVAYVGGGFSRGVHSVIEPAVYNAHIGFGPNIEMLDEAKELIGLNSAYKISNSKEMINFLNLIDNDTKITIPQQFIFNNKDATNKILEVIIQ